MTELLHLTSRADWLAAQSAGDYRVSARGVTLAEEGFIHCSLASQLRFVAETFYGADDDLVVVVIDSERLGAPCGSRPSSPAARSSRTSTGPCRSTLSLLSCR